MAETPVDQTRETHGFQTEVQKLLDLMIHSLYGNKEIFLRELISNASDAADKLRFEALSDDGLYEGDGELKVRVSFDADARTITVRDNGVGMTREEIAANLGTIARSGTRQFFESLTGDSAKDTQLIGQFGVGFYSSFIVSDHVTVTSRRAGRPAAEGVRWESSGEGEFTVETTDVEARGTEVVLQLRDGEDEFLDRYRLRGIVRKYSDHVSIPILMPGEGKDDEDGGEAKDEETINAATAMWTRNKSELSDDDYNGFYKHVAHDFEDPLAWIHSRVEGNLEYSLLLFVPARAPFDMWDRNVRRGVKLYVRRVFIMDDAEHLMPAYLRFVRGVIDSADLPLNISREILQENRQVQSIRTGAVKRVLDLLAAMARDDTDKYAKFWDAFGRVLKEGVVEDSRNRDQIAKLLRFASTHDAQDAQTVSLDDYVSRMKDGQKAVYYITADGYRTARSSPHLEVFDKHGLEVLLLADPIDEWLVMHLTEYDDRPLVSVMKGELDLGDVAAGRRDAGGREGRRPCAGAGAVPRGAFRSHQGRAGDPPVVHVAGLSRQRGVRDEPPPRAHPRRGGTEDRLGEAHPGDQPRPSHGCAARRRDRSVAAAGLGEPDIRPGDAQRGRQAGGPGRVRAAHERAHRHPGAGRRLEARAQAGAQAGEEGGDGEEDAEQDHREASGGGRGELHDADGTDRRVTDDVSTMGMVVRPGCSARCDAGVFAASRIRRRLHGGGARLPPGARCGG